MTIFLSEDNMPVYRIDTHRPLPASRDQQRRYLTRGHGTEQEPDTIVTDWDDIGAGRETRKLAPHGCDNQGRYVTRQYGQQSAAAVMAARCSTEAGHAEPRSKWSPLVNVLAIFWGWLTAR